MNKLLSRLMFAMFVQFTNNDEGTVPERLFELTYKLCILVKSMMQDGMLPLKIFVFNNTWSRVFSVQSDVGIEPESEL